MVASKHSDNITESGDDRAILGTIGISKLLPVVVILGLAGEEQAM